MVITTENGPAATVGESVFVETDIVLTLDSGCCNHIVDLADAQGYAGVLRQSPGSKAGHAPKHSLVAHVSGEPVTMRRDRATNQLGRALRFRATRATQRE